MHLFLLSANSPCLLLLFPQGHEGRYTIYVHASREKPEHASPLFIDRDIRSEKVLYNFTALMKINSLHYKNEDYFQLIVVIWSCRWWCHCFTFCCRWYGVRFPWLMQRGGCWQMHWKTLTISILCYSLTGIKQILFWTNPIIFNEKIYLISVFVFFYSCVPLHNFDYVYNYLIGTNISFIDS